MSAPVKAIMLSGLLVGALAVPMAMADQIRPGTVLYKPKEDAAPSELKGLNALLRSQGLLQERVLENLNLHIAHFDSVGREKAIAKLLETSGLVKFAEPDYEVPLTLTPDDPGFASQWQHSAMNTPQAWEQAVGQASVRVAVCDTGVDSDHEDLAANLILPGYNAQDGSTDVEDAHGHGSGTIGTLGAVGNNGIGVAGVNWNVSVLPVRINISDGNSSAYISTMAECIRWSADQGARVVNLSYGGIQYATIDDAAQYLRDRNGLLFMSAGNDGALEGSFPDYTSFVAVGATDENNVKAGFSNYGEFVDVVAPGVSLFTTYKDNGYVYYSGTSFSSPAAAGVAALMVAANPEISADEIEAGLFNTATDLGDELLYGHGLVNAQAAVAYALHLNSNMAPVASLSSSAVTGPLPLSVQFDASGSYDPDGRIVSYQWDFGDGTQTSGVQVSHEYTQSGQFAAVLTVTDNNGRTATDSVMIEVSNELPVAQLVATPVSGDVPLLVNFDASGSYDTDGSILSYAWDFGDGTRASGQNVQHTYQTGGQFNALLTVTDNGGAQATDSVVISVNDPTLLDAPTGLTASVNGADVTLSWQDNSANETGYVVERAAKVRGKYAFETVATLEQNTVEFVDTGVPVGTYQYRIYAYNSAKQAYSDAVQVKVESAVAEPPPPAPGVLTAPSDLSTGLNGSQVSLSWTDNSDSEEGFYIERGLKERNKIVYQRIGSVAANSTGFTDNLSTPGTYYYQVQAYRSGEVSAYSNSSAVRLR
ncbi:PKD domain-containing protein [Thiomicrorhabdus sp. zzn3]|uniref:PKD domain-containing protein n=1 Tax=Thiomicrorhabdus sp. zzn3 TaxID=3039775 RepID=UPI0024364724|nr:PKD domain-containing protein [Thiomicrorhabdus sp. zzn3]MDG6779150.1 PKD domain-containing protein [Thiomicrorhabdus sp. zzn3]